MGLNTGSKARGQVWWDGGIWPGNRCADGIVLRGKGVLRKERLKGNFDPLV